MIIQIIFTVGIICGTRASGQMCPSQLQGQYSRAVIFLSLTSERHADGCDSPPVLFLLRKNLKEWGPFSLHILWELIIDQVCIYQGLITTPNQRSFSGRAVGECQSLQLNNQQIGSGCLSPADAHYQLSSAHWQSNRLERWEDERLALDEMLVWYGEEQMLSLLLVCLCSEESVSNLHNEKCFPALLHAAERCTCGSELQISLHKRFPLLLEELAWN